jgi:hypothetical protein
MSGKCQAAVQLAQMARGKPKRFSAAYLDTLRERLKGARAKRAEKILRRNAGGQRAGDSRYAEPPCSQSELGGN